MLFTSDRGLCGGYNANLIRAAEAFIRRKGPVKEVELTLVGRKGADHFRRRRAIIADRLRGILATPAQELAAEIGQKLHRRDSSTAKPTRSIFCTAGSARRFPRCRPWKSFCRYGERNQRYRGATTDGISVRARRRGDFGELLAADYRRGDAAGAPRSDGKRARRAHDRDGFGNDAMLRR